MESFGVREHLRIFAINFANRLTSNINHLFLTNKKTLCILANNTNVTEIPLNYKHTSNEVILEKCDARIQ